LGAAWTFAVRDPPRPFVLNLSPEDPQSAAKGRTAAGRLADWAKRFELVRDLKPASDGSARLEIKLSTSSTEDLNGWVAFGFFFVKLVTDPIVTAPESWNQESFPPANSR
jgi:hypothetical protein